MSDKEIKKTKQELKNLELKLKNKSEELTSSEKIDKYSYFINSPYALT
ncbi:hypothetical protein [Piscirickettsia salmonis]|nr:hypothetical protein [Piscirickettsia salmonis]QHS33813.1 hypothetical protein GW535_16225 [Piscirickettsia salmonis]QIX56804.1 hypothetical protein GW536_16850 [Piscirickettsia salmonis]QNR80524.1 hypothetical protein ICC15_00240 [Piscirickettsia salmonis]